MVEWRSREKIDGILEETLAEPAVLQRTYPMGWYGKDRTGRPVRYDCFGRVDAEALWGLLGGGAPSPLACACLVAVFLVRSSRLRVSF